MKLLKTKLHKKLGGEEFQQMRYLASTKGPAKHLQMSLLFLLEIWTTESHPRKAALLVPLVFFLFFFTKSNLPLYIISAVFSHAEMCYYSEQLVFLFALREQGWMKQEWGLEWEQGLVYILWITFLVQESMNTHKVLFCCTGWPSLISMASSHSCLPFSKTIFSLLCLRHQVHIA